MKGKRYVKHDLYLIFLILFFVGTPAMAGILKIETQTTVKNTGNQLEIKVVLVNAGTSVAHNLQVHLNVLGTVLDSALKPQLDPGESSIVSFEKSAQELKSGRYPLTVFVDFHDGNQYPFSALSGMTFSVGPGVNSDLAVHGKDVAMATNGKLSLDIKNIGANPKKIVATLVLPKELSTPTPQLSFQMGPRSKKNIDFEIQNFSALAGANYPVFCYFEYDKADAHHTAVGMAVIKIIEPQNLFRRYRWLWIALAVVLGIMLLILMVRNRLQSAG
jgi:hypothetical protein